MLNRTKHQPAPRRAIIPTKKRPSGLFALIFAVLAATSSLMTYALWGLQTTTEAAIAVGTMDIGLGVLTVSAKPCDSTCVGWESSNPPRRQITIEQEVDGFIDGDNLSVVLGVGFSALPLDVHGTWHVEEAGEQVAPASGDVPLADSLVIPNSHATGTPSWVIVIRLTTTSDGLTWVDPTTSPHRPNSLDLGTLTISADQVRCGTDFVNPCVPEAGGV